ncbi:hypothetical protein HK096_005196 [Nowakowskiella sp. JEL0078]|nr:hypothetical protein HK096_005196 [Nowakowskiella sp. JEL0078]
MNTKSDEEVNVQVEDLIDKPKRESSVIDTNLVTWDGPNDPENPKNWSNNRKWIATIVVSLYALISPITSSMVAPGLAEMARDLKLTQNIEIEMVISIFVLAFAFGPFIMGPLSEIYGRVIVLQISNVVYLIFNLLCGFCTEKWQIILLRFLAGLGGSAPLSIGSAVLADLFVPEERGKAISIYSMAPLLGPALAPVLGALITEAIGWRWIFHITTIAGVLVTILGQIYIPETFDPVLLKRKVERLKKETGNSNLYATKKTNEPTSKVLTSAFVRPMKLLATQPIMQVLSLYMAFLYVVSTFTQLWMFEYGESVSISGLNFISMGLGFFLATQIAAPLTDIIYKKLKIRYGGVGIPEFRIPLMIPGAILTPIGMFIYGWSAQYHLHWFIPNLGVFIFCAGIAMGFQCISVYLVDTYTINAASAMAAANFLRSLAGFGFPLFSVYLYDALGYGWGNSLLAFIGIALGFPGPIFLWYFGAKLRAKSTYAAG